MRTPFQKRLLSGFGAFAFVCGASAQGTFLSNLNQPSGGSLSVGSNSWLAALFLTGNNLAGYELNAVQLQMSSTSANPGQLFVSIYSESSGLIVPGNSIGFLTGSNPATGGLYTFSSTGVPLSATTRYITLC
jgi:hypothetical protein